MTMRGDRHLRAARAMQDRNNAVERRAENLATRTITPHSEDRLQQSRAAFHESRMTCSGKVTTTAYRSAIGTIVDETAFPKALVLLF